MNLLDRGVPSEPGGTFEEALSSTAAHFTPQGTFLSAHLSVTLSGCFLQLCDCEDPHQKFVIYRLSGSSRIDVVPIRRGSRVYYQRYQSGSLVPEVLTYTLRLLPSRCTKSAILDLLQFVPRHPNHRRPTSLTLVNQTIQLPMEDTQLEGSSDEGHHATHRRSNDIVR